MSSQLTVERTFKLTGRPWLLVTGRLDGEPLNIGDQLTIAGPGQPPVGGVVRSIELHSAPGTTTIAVDLELDDRIRPGTVVSRAE
ncbi:hypothetical protein AB0H43_28765 [Hamadaea sp. NPDC050747]|uniref:hypothetical protein n=1 Tax=Hamadaea sp. NPDC050747 TaxID=3155789 RepID=UPI0033C1D2CD